MLLWLIVATGTIKNIFYGNLVDAPCLREMEKKARAAEEQKEQQTA